MTLKLKSNSALLALYADILDELRSREILRTSNNPVADYAEWLVSRALDLTLASSSVAGFDAEDSLGVRYQIKARRLTPFNGSRQLSAIRGLDADPPPFDLLAGVLFGRDFAVQRAALIPVVVVRGQSVWMPHVNGWRFVLRDSLWDRPEVQDITDKVERAG